MESWDADGHAYEWEGTFADPYWDGRFRDLRPRVVDVAGEGSLSWLIDGRLYPVLSGPRQRLGQTPASKDGVASKSHQRRLHDPVESSELRSAAPRLTQLDDEHIHLQVNFPTLLLSWPAAYTPGLGAAIARSYNSWMADVSSQAADRLRWVTYIDPTDPQACAREIERTKALGSSGVMVFGLAGNRHLDDPLYEPVWRACAETGQPISSAARSTLGSK